MAGREPAPREAYLTKRILLGMVRIMGLAFALAMCAQGQGIITTVAGTDSVFQGDGKAYAGVVSGKVIPGTSISGK